MPIFPLFTSLPTGSTALGALARAGLAPPRPVPVFLQAERPQAMRIPGQSWPAAHLDLRCENLRDADEVTSATFTLDDLAGVGLEVTSPFQPCTCSSFDQRLREWADERCALSAILLMLEDLDCRAEQQLGYTAGMASFYRLATFALTHPRRAVTPRQSGPDVREAVAALTEALDALTQSSAQPARDASAAAALGWHRYVVDVPNRPFDGRWQPFWRADGYATALAGSVLLGAFALSRSGESRLAVLADPKVMCLLETVTDFGPAEPTDDLVTLESLADTLDQLTDTIRKQQPQVPLVQAQRAALASLTAAR